MQSLAESNSLLKVVFLLLVIGIFQSAYGSTIFGTVYDNRQNALPNVNVELLDQYRSLKQYTITDGIGRYSFDSVTDGNWYVRVLPFRYDFDEQVQSIEIYTISQVSNKPGYTSQVLDFVLTPRKGTLAAAQADVIYAQEIPSEAKKAFDTGIKAMKKGKPDEAILSFQEAIKIFPDYFLANHYLGAVYFGKKDYERAAPPLIKAAGINEKSGVTLYYLGYSLQKLNYNKAAIVSLKAAAIITPASPAVFLALGIAQRMERNYAEAEKSFLQTKKLQKTENSELYKELAALYGETQQYDKGVESLEQMLQSGTFSDADTAKIKEQIKIWKDMALKTKQPAKSGS